jgi:hypothetical protein
MIDVSNREIDLVQLSIELTAAGISFRALGTRNGMLHTYTEDGDFEDLPPEAEAVVDAHVPPPPPPTRDELLQETVEQGKQAIMSATSLEEIKVIFAATLDGLGAAISGDTVKMDESNDALLRIMKPKR